MAKILIADDDGKIRDILHSLLRDHELEIATTWPEVLALLEENAFDLVITDVVMPGYKDMIKSGIRDVFEKRDMPVIFISAYNERSLGTLSPEMRFVKKPFSVRVLKSYVDKALGKAPSK